MEQPTTGEACPSVLPLPNAEERAALAAEGYVLVRGLGGQLGTQAVPRLKRAIAHLLLEEGEQAGSEFKKEPGVDRLAALVGKGAVFEAVLTAPNVLKYPRQVLGPDFKLASVNARVVPAGATVTQPLHADMSRTWDKRGPVVCNVLVMLDAYTTASGPLRVVPGSHAWGRLPSSDMADAKAKHPKEVYVEGEAGDAIVIDASVWHGGMMNRSCKPKAALHLFFCRRDIPQQQYQREAIGAAQQELLSPLARWVCALDDPANDAMSASYTQVAGAITTPSGSRL